MTIIPGIQIKWQWYSEWIKWQWHCIFTLNELRYDLTDTAGVLENKVLGMPHGLDD